MLAGLDVWMARNPWHPRIVPLVVYVALLLPIDYLRDVSMWTYPVLYVLQCAIVCWLLWRYRRLLPELNLRFHWGAIPVGVGVLIAWIALGQWTIELFPGLFSPELRPDGEQAHYFVEMRDVSLGLYWTSLVLRLVGMSLIVPLFEELFTRSLLLRSFHRPRRLALGVLQIVADMPVIGEWFERTSLGQRVVHREPEGVFGKEFLRNPLGVLSVCGVAVSTALFTLNHLPRDWAACVVCGVAYCLLVGWTNQWGRGVPASTEASAHDAARPGPHPRALGLGPVVWAHGITNALLWAYCVGYSDWQFL
jgi:membrane protease YdiL (CAAX protease family)